MTLTLILTGGQRLAELNRFFLSILNLSSKESLQIVFIDQGGVSVDPRFERVSWVDIVHVKASPMPLSAARNMGLRYATGDIVGFPDDDCWYPEGLVSLVLNFFRVNKEVSALCTNVIDPQNGLSYGDRPIDVIINISYRNMFRLPISVGIFVRRDVLEEVGCYFDEQLGAGTKFGSGEETELIYRLLSYNKGIRYDGYIQVFHPSPEDRPGNTDKYYSYGLGFGFLNGRIIRDKKFSCVGYLVYVLYRSIGGVIYHINSGRRAQYLNRILGIFVGLWYGLRLTKKISQN